MNFNYSAFPENLESVDHIHDSHSWDQWNGSDKTVNQVDEYRYHIGDDDHHYQYRTWYPETSIVGDNVGLLVSTKIDYLRGTGDDHLVLLAGFLKTGTLFIAQARAMFHGNSGSDFAIDPVTTGDIAQGVYDAITEISQDKSFGGNHDTKGRNGYAYIAKANLIAMTKSLNL